MPATISRDGDILLTKNHAQEGLSRAYVQALSSAARVWLSMKDEFDYGFDGQLDLIARVETDPATGKQNLVKAGYTIDFQLKCSKDWKLAGDDVQWSMKSKAYNKLAGRGPGAVPAILILMCLPENEEEWMDISEDSLLLRKCCYFTTVKGPLIENENTTRQISFPRRNLLNVSTLTTILDDNRKRLDAAFSAFAE
ncbi:DUF4365 domain-containing protein [Sinorhizobium meliloti]|nr:DUF4365 domain-containing protein [Sinorhizobium meliloti]MDW9800834.1 DUF4365 domain-containing protein [Sinorhizobium meliloti]